MKADAKDGSIEPTVSNAYANERRNSTYLRISAPWALSPSLDASLLVRTCTKGVLLGGSLDPRPELKGKTMLLRALRVIRELGLGAGRVFGSIAKVLARAPMHTARRSSAGPASWPGIPAPGRALKPP